MPTSLITPVFLPEAIESVLSQEFNDFELIIADDASADESAAVLRSFAERDPRIRLFSHSSNIGMVNNWNFCLKQARGEHIKYVFGDDLLLGRKSLGRYVALCWMPIHHAVRMAASVRALSLMNSRVCWIFIVTLPTACTTGAKSSIQF